MQHPHASLARRLSSRGKRGSYAPDGHSSGALALSLLL
jgi:hypothetical protein